MCSNSLLRRSGTVQTWRTTTSSHTMDPMAAICLPESRMLASRAFRLGRTSQEDTPPCAASSQRGCVRLVIAKTSCRVPSTASAPGWPSSRQASCGPTSLRTSAALIRTTSAALALPAHPRLLLLLRLRHLRLSLRPPQRRRQLTRLQHPLQPPQRPHHLTPLRPPLLPPQRSRHLTRLQHPLRPPLRPRHLTRLQHPLQPPL